MSENIIRDVVTRTNGELYLGVVGPIRSGKSTFIRRFVETKIVPFIKEEGTRQKVVDELPQSAEGRNIMTVEPKFIPSDITTIKIGDDISFKARLVDCVGYIMQRGEGYLNQDGSARLIKTPWFTEEIPFSEAASLGTKKVIENHANIGIVVTSDGSFGDFKREEYEIVEEKIIAELKELGKPFVIILNTKDKDNIDTIKLKEDMESKYDNTVVVVNVKEMTNDDIDIILKAALEEFDINHLALSAPEWIDILDDDVTFKQDFNELLKDTTGTYRKLKDVFKIKNRLYDSGLFKDVEVTNIDPSTGEVIMNLDCDDGKYFEIIEDLMGEKIENKTHFLSILQNYKKAIKLHTLFGDTIETLNVRGYDIRVPEIKDMILEKPDIAKIGSRYGIKINTIAKAIVLTTVNVNSVFEPVIGSLEQTEQLVTHMQEIAEEDPLKLYETEIFGRKLKDVIIDGIMSKVNGVNDEIMIKYQEAMEKVINHKQGRIIAILI